MLKGSYARLSKFLQQLSGTTVLNLMELAQEPVRVMFTTDTGDYRTLQETRKGAYDLYCAGMTLYFDLLPTLEEARDWKEVLAETVGQQPYTVLTSIFVSRKGRLTECHFDSNDNFTVQLRGRKRWCVSRNEQLRFPICRYTASVSDSDVSKMHGIDKVVPPYQMPELVELNAGDLVYVPRGFWHSVECLDDDSVSLNLCIKPTCWADLILPAIKQQLLSGETYREAPASLRHTGTEDLNKKVDSLLFDLAATARTAAENISALTRQTDGKVDSKTMFRRNSLVTIRQDIHGGERVLTAHCPAHKPQTIIVNDAQISVVQSISKKRNVFTVDDIKAECLPIDLQAILVVLKSLIESRVIYIANEDGRI